MHGSAPENEVPTGREVASLAEGQRFSARRTFTDGDVALFCGVTGDVNPYHQDEAFARTTGFGRRIVPGLLTGSMLTHIGGLLGFLASEMTFEFAGPVFIGDTVTCTVTIERVRDDGKVEASASVANEDGAEVLRARVAGRPGHIRLAR